MIFTPTLSSSLVSSCSSVAFFVPHDICTKTTTSAVEPSSRSRWAATATLYTKPLYSGFLSEHPPTKNAYAHFRKGACDVLFCKWSKDLSRNFGGTVAFWSLYWWSWEWFLLTRWEWRVEELTASDLLNFAKEGLFSTFGDWPEDKWDFTVFCAWTSTLSGVVDLFWSFPLFLTSLWREDVPERIVVDRRLVVFFGDGVVFLLFIKEWKSCFTTLDRIE